MDAMLFIGNDRATIDAATKAILDILKNSNDVSSVAALNALVELARTPQNTSISNCVFTDNGKSRRRK